MIESHRSGKDVSSLSAVPGEKEVLFPRNSQFRVTGVATTVAEKKNLLGAREWPGASVEGLTVCKVAQV